MERAPSALSSATVSILGSGTSSTVPRSMSIGVSVVSRFTLNASDQRAYPSFASQRISSIVYSP